MYIAETTRYEAMQDEWEDKQPEHTPCWSFKLPAVGIYDWTDDRDELDQWPQSAIKAGLYAQINEVAPF